MDLRVAFVADPEPSEVVQVSEAAFHDPALDAEPGAVLLPAPGDQRLGPALPPQAAVLVVVVVSVGEHEVGFLSRPAVFAGDRPGVKAVEQRWQLGDVVRCPPVSATASGMPEASTSRWCFEPVRPTIYWDGPVRSSDRTGEIAADLVAKYYPT